MEKKIIKEDEVILYGKKYKEITYDNGETILKRYNDKAKMWITLKFAKEHNQEIIDDFVNLAVSSL